MNARTPVIALLSLGILGAVESPPPATRRYTVALQGNRAGEATSRIAGNRAEFTFHFNDRGRGPKLATRLVLDANGIPILIDTTGNDYYKSTVDDHFATTDGTAAWTSASEKGQRRDPGRAFYVSFNAAPQEAGILAEALLRSPDHSLPLLPEGTAHIDKVRELTVAGRAGERKITLYEVSGLDFSPSLIWLDSDGLFASVTGWTTVVPEGWDDVVDKLRAIQDESIVLRAGTLARKLARRPPGGFTIRHARLFDPVTLGVREGMTVVVSGNRIASVSPDAEGAPPPGAEPIDAAGKTLLPGLWDMHVHLGEGDGLLDIANGITSVRDLGNDSRQLLAWKKSFDEGGAVGPRVIPAVLVDGRGPFSGPTPDKVDDAREARQTIEKYRSLGYAQLKIYSSIKPELVPVLTKLAHDAGMRVSGHVPAFMTAEQFVLAGADEIQHVNFLFLNFLFDTVRDTRTPARFTAVAEHAAEIDPSQERVRKFFALLKGHATVIDPTVNAFESLFVARRGAVDPGYAAVADRFPPQIRRQFLAGGLPVPEGKDALYRDAFRSVLRMVRALHDEGIPIVAGTDALAGFSLARELELYVQAGIPAPEVLRIATIGGARVMKKDSELGSIEAGKLADLLLVDGDPTKRISDVRNVDIVLKDGVLYRPAEIDREIGVKTPEGQSPEAGVASSASASRAAAQKGFAPS